MELLADKFRLMEYKPGKKIRSSLDLSLAFGSLTSMNDSSRQQLGLMPVLAA